jgi:hypothetical protein
VNPPPEINPRRDRRRDAIALAGLAALIFAPFLLRAGQGSSALSLPLNHDIALQWVPFRAFIGRAFAEGYFPLWVSQVFVGFPFAAFSHTGVFYPLAFILDGQNYARSVNWFYPVHIFIAAAGVYSLTRRAGLSAFPAFFAAMTYAFTGKTFYFVHFLPSAMSNPWAPWFLFAAAGLLKRPRLQDLILAGAALALQILGGDVESTAYGLLFGLPAAALLAGPSDARKHLPALLAALALAGLLAAITLFPLLEYSERFARNQGVTSDYFSQRRLPFSLLLSVLLPLKPAADARLLGMDGPCFHIGAAVFALAGLAAAVRAGQRSRAIAALALLALAFAFGSFSLLDRLQYALPVIRSMGSPEQAFFIGQLLFAILAAQGLDWLRARTPLRLPALAIAAAHLVLVYGLAVANLPKNPPSLFDRPPWLKDLAKKIKTADLRSIMVTREGPLDPQLLLHSGLQLDFNQIDGWITVPPRRYLELLSRADPRAARFQNGKLDRLGLNGELRDGKFIDASSMPLLDLLGLAFIIDRGVPLKFSSPLELHLLEPESILRRGPMDPVDKVWENDLTMGANERRVWRLFIQEKDQLALGPAFQSTGRTVRQDCDFDVEIGRGATVENILHESFSSRDDALGPRYHPGVDLARFKGREIFLAFSSRCPAPDPHGLFIVRPAAIVNPDKPIQRVAEFEGDISLYFNRDALPRAFIVHKARVIEDGEKLLDQLARAELATLLTTAFVERDTPDLPDPAKHQPWSGVPDSAQKQKEAPGLLTYKVVSNGPGLLFLSDQHYPGWRAFVEGDEKTILRADSNFRAVPVPSGLSRVRFSFEPASFRVGLWANLSAAGFLLAAAIVSCKRRAVPPRGSGI